MVDKLYQSKFFQSPEIYRINLDDGGLMSGHESMFLMWKLLKYFNPKSILEIGFGAGQMTGLFVEASPSTTKIISVDITDKYFNQLRNIFSNNNLTLIHSDSRNLELNEKFDFIYIDGDHTYDGVCNDLKKCLPLLGKTSILCVDDYLDIDDVNRAVKEYLLGQNKFVPFLCGCQKIFFHHQDHDANEFLDSFIMNNSNDILEFTTIDFFGFNVLKGQVTSLAIQKDAGIFQKMLEFYDH